MLAPSWIHVTRFIIRDASYTYPVQVDTAEQLSSPKPQGFRSLKTLSLPPL